MPELTTPQIISIVIFIVVFAFIISEKIHRTTAALAGAVVLILTGIVTFDVGMEHIDFGTLGVLVGMMIFVAVVKQSGIFEYIAIKTAKAAKGNPWIIMVLFCFMMSVAGLSYKVIAVVLVAGSALVLALLLVITQVNFQLPAALDKTIGYQLGRIQDWLSDDADNADGRLQQQNSITAIGSGKLTGKGLNNNKVSSANKGNFVSQNHNDFIFAVAGEELGFFGCCGIILLLFLILVECIRTSRKAKDLSGTLICCGMAGLIAFQSFLNISVATGILPNTGTPLPFVSYGLTSLVTLYIGMGLVLNVGLQNRDFVTRNYELLRRKTINEHRIDRA